MTIEPRKIAVSEWPKNFSDIKSECFLKLENFMKSIFSGDFFRLFTCASFEVPKQYIFLHSRCRPGRNFLRSGNTAIPVRNQNERSTMYEGTFQVS